MKGQNPIEVAKTVLEVADVAWSAVEHCHHHTHSHTEKTPFDVSHGCEEDELKSLRSENERLKRLLEQNLMLLQSMSQSPSLLQDCPPDLHDRLVAAVESGSFLKQLESLNRNSVDGNGCQFPFKEATGFDTETAELLVNMSLEEPSWWVWVTEDMAPGNFEERSGIDNDNYVIISEEYVVDAVANFMARCIVSNSRAQKMSPEELQKTLTKALEGKGKVERLFNIWHAAQMFYVLSTWGLAAVGLYKSRSVVRLAAKGVHKTGKNQLDLTSGKHWVQRFQRFRFILHISSVLFFPIKITMVLTYILPQTRPIQAKGKNSSTDNNRNIHHIGIFLTFAIKWCFMKWLRVMM